jgi:hypothetical protein
MTHYKKRTDANHAEIMQAFKKLGASVLDLSRVGMGCPDLLIGVANTSALVEVKVGNAKFTPAQETFMANWQGGTVSRIDSPEAAERLVKCMKGLNYD